MNELLEQLRQRKVIRVGLIYCAAMFAVLEFSDIAFPRLGFSDAAVDAVLIVGLIGLPIALCLAWMFDIRSDPRAVEARRIACPPMNACSELTRTCGCMTMRPTRVRASA